MKNQTESRILKNILENIQEQKKLILLLSCLVVFTTTYLLILPAFTLDKEEAAENRPPRQAEPCSGKVPAAKKPH